MARGSGHDRRLLSALRNGLAGPVRSGGAGSACGGLRSVGAGPPCHSGRPQRAGAGQATAAPADPGPVHRTAFVEGSGRLRRRPGRARRDPRDRLRHRASCRLPAVGRDLGDHRPIARQRSARVHRSGRLFATQHSRSSPRGRQGRRLRDPASAACVRRPVLELAA